MKKMWIVLAFLLLAGCGGKDQCPWCSHKVDFSKDVFCSNCGTTFTGIKPDGYSSSPDQTTPSQNESTSTQELIVGTWNVDLSLSDTDEWRHEKKYPETFTLYNDGSSTLVYGYSNELKRVETGETFRTFVVSDEVKHGPYVVVHDGAGLELCDGSIYGLDVRGDTMELTIDGEAFYYKKQ